MLGTSLAMAASISVVPAGDVTANGTPSASMNVTSTMPHGYT